MVAASRLCAHSWGFLTPSSHCGLDYSVLVYEDAVARLTGILIAYVNRTGLHVCRLPYQQKVLCLISPYRLSYATWPCSFGIVYSALWFFFHLICPPQSLRFILCRLARLGHLWSSRSCCYMDFWLTLPPLEHERHFARGSVFGQLGDSCVGRYED